jgi:hypothetical protein
MKDFYYTMTIEDVFEFFKHKMKELNLREIRFEYAGSSYTIEAPEKK